MIAKESRMAAEELGYRDTNQRIGKEPIFYNGKTYIYQDIGSSNNMEPHNGTVWKQARSIADLGSNKIRRGTYNADVTTKVGK